MFSQGDAWYMSVRRVESILDPNTSKNMPSSWQKVVYTPPICITIRLPFVSRCFCRSIGVRGRWDTQESVQWWADSRKRLDLWRVPGFKIWRLDISVHVRPTSDGTKPQKLSSTLSSWHRRMMTPDLGAGHQMLGIRASCTSLHLHGSVIRDGPATTTTIIFKKRFASDVASKRPTALDSDSVKRHLRGRHLSVLSLKFDFISDGGCTREEQIALSLKRHLCPHGGREPKAFWICFSRVHPPSEIKSNLKFKTLKRHLLKRHLTLWLMTHQMKNSSGKCKVLIFLRVWSFDSHALYILSTDDSGRTLQSQRSRPESSADKMYRACESKDQTLKNIRTLHFPE